MKIIYLQQLDSVGNRVIRSNISNTKIIIIIIIKKYNKKYLFIQNIEKLI